MQYEPPWIVFPSHLSAPTVRSLCLLFILEEMIHLFENTKPLEHFVSSKNSFPPRNIPPDKLCFYCHILLQKSQVDGRTLLKMLDEIRMACLQCRSDRLHSEKEMQHEWFLELWRQKLLKIFSHLIPFLQEARTDENVLLSLLEKKEKLNSHLGAYSIEDLLSNFFPHGKDHLHAVLHEGFHRRKFSEFFQSKQHLLEIDAIT